MKKKYLSLLLTMSIFLTNGLSLVSCGAEREASMPNYSNNNQNTTPNPPDNSQGTTPNPPDNNQGATPNPPDNNQGATITHTHKMTYHPKNLSCTDNGNIEYYYCSECNKNFSDAKGTSELSSIIIPPSGHNLQFVFMRVPTCTTAGQEFHYRCQNCNKCYFDEYGQNETTTILIPATGHSYSQDWSFDESYHWHQATCEHKNETSIKEKHSIKDGSCTQCSFNKDGFIFVEYKDGYAITECNGTNTSVTIPLTYHEKPVISITNMSKNDSIEKIILSDNIREINSLAFSNCTKLSTVMLNEGLTSIGFSAFENTSVNSLVVPSTLKYLNQSLIGSKIETLEFKSVTEEHITALFSYRNGKCSLKVPSSCYWRGEIDNHFTFKSYRKETVATSSAGVSLTLQYPYDYQLTNRWFTINGQQTFLYGEYEISTKRVQVKTYLESGQNYSVWYDCPNYISGNYYYIPATLKKIIVHSGNSDVSFVQGLDIEIVAK